jgi:hypothetical protein
MAASSDRERRSASRPRPWSGLGGALLASLLLAAVSLLAPFAPAFDPWAWLVWGREIAAFELDTGGGPSWKPLPSLAAVPLAGLGDAAPELWLLIARVGWLMSLLLAWRLAARLADPPGASAGPRLAAGALAALALLLLEDSFTPWLRQAAGGLSEPLLAALVLAAVDREIEGRRGQALALGTAAALIRPEAWPPLAAYAIWVWRREPDRRRSSRLGALRVGAAAALLAIPALWFVPDLLGAGDPLEGAVRAREGTGPPLGEAVEALGRGMAMLPAAIWIAAGLEVGHALRDGDRRIAVLALGAVAWILTVAAMAASGYAGLPRFMVPAAAIVAVLGGIGIARLGIAAFAVARGDRAASRGRAALAAALTLALLVQALPRARELPGEARRAAELADPTEAALALGAALRQAGAGCEKVASSELLIQTPLAWALERPLSEVRFGGQRRGSGIIVVEGPPPRRLRRAGAPIASVGGLTAYARECPGARDAARVADVSWPAPALASHTGGSSGSH